MGRGIFHRPRQPGHEFSAILVLAGQAAPPQGCSANLEAGRRLRSLAARSSKMTRYPRFLLLPLAVTAAAACTLFDTASPSPGTILEIATDESPSPENFSLVLLHPSQGDLDALLAAHAQNAADLDRKAFVEFSADWCPPCIALAHSLGDQRMVEAFQGTYIVRLDLDEWKSHLSDTEFIVLGVPVFFELDSEGRPTGRTLTGAAWREDIPENMAPPLKEFFEGASPK